MRVRTIAFIGFGEAAQAFVEGWRGSPPARLTGFDRKTDCARTRAGKLAEFARTGVSARRTAADAIADADLIVSVVTADQALAAARSLTGSLRRRARYFDFNSVAPETKRLAAEAIGAAGGDYVDVAVMAPVRPALLATPLLVSGNDPDGAVEALSALGFSARAVVGGVGQASAIKMIRSIMVKGIEALTAECVLSAVAAGVAEEVLASLDASELRSDWRSRAGYNLERMIVHGRRRADEMSEAAKTAGALGTGGEMARATAAWQRRIGELELPVAALLADNANAILSSLRASPA